MSWKRGSLIRTCAWIGYGGLCGYATLQSDDASLSQTLVYVPLICCLPPRIKIISLFLSKTKRRKKKKHYLVCLIHNMGKKSNSLLIIVLFFIFSRSFVCKCMHDACNKIAIWSALPHPIGQKIYTNCRFTNQRFKSIKTFLCLEKKSILLRG